MSSTRNSSFELLRIILIIMILVEHGNMWFIGGGYSSEWEHWAKCIVESACIGSVNAFVLISGWFGIRSDLKKIGKLVFMLMFCTIPLLVVALLFDWLPFSKLASMNGVYEYVLGGNAYWFVADYIGLLIIAPMLNKGIQTMDKRQLRTSLLAGYTLIVIYDFVFRVPVLGSEGGYSILWFGFIYLLAQYMRAYGLGIIDRFCWPILVAAVIMQSVLFYWGLIGMRYTNPLILIGAVCLISIFKNRNFHSPVINYVATSCLMAYMLHMQPILVPYIRRFLLAEYVGQGYWIYMVEVFILSIAVFLIAVLLNKVQSVIYQKLIKCLSL